MRSSAVVFLLACFEAASGSLLKTFKPKIQQVEDSIGLCYTDRPGLGAGYFTQTLNHSNPSQGTFKQKYFWNSRYWNGPGSPVVLMTPGETELDPYCGFLGLGALTGQIGAAVGGAVILIEHRYWGDSSPFPLQTTETLQHLTLDNAVADLVNFAKNVKLPFDTNSSSNAPQAPWILSGGSYSGALAAWTAKLSPGTFWVYHASSAPVEAIYDYWSYFEPIQQGMAQNCSRDLANVTDHIDGVLKTGKPAEVQALKKSFGLGDIEHDDDFTSAISNAIGEWQNSTLSTGYTAFYQMCDAVEGYGVYDSATRQNGTDVADRTAYFSWWFKNKYLPGWCYQKYSYEEWNDPMSTGCFDSRNLSSPLYTDRATNNTEDLQWNWLLCNEPFAYWQTGDVPAGGATLVSRLVTADYYQQQCALFFPPSGAYAYGASLGRTVEAANNRTDGWDLKGQRILWVNGEFDPWRSASVSSVYRPGGPLNSTADAPVVLVEGGKHCEDLAVIRDNAYLTNLQIGEIRQIVAWVNEFYAAKASQRGGASGRPGPEAFTRLLRDSDWW